MGGHRGLEGKRGGQGGREPTATREQPAAGCYVSGARVKMEAAAAATAGRSVVPPARSSARHPEPRPAFPPGTWFTRSTRTWGAPFGPGSKSSTEKAALLWAKRRKKVGGRPTAVHSSAWFTAAAAGEQGTMGCPWGPAEERQQSNRAARPRQGRKLRQLRQLRQLTRVVRHHQAQAAQRVAGQDLPPCQAGTVPKLPDLRYRRHEDTSGKSRAWKRPRHQTAKWIRHATSPFTPQQQGRRQPSCWASPARGRRW